MDHTATSDAPELLNPPIYETHCGKGTPGPLPAVWGHCPFPQ
jgi:hypothetical protein